MNVNIQKINPNATIPTYQTEHAAALDIHACLDEQVVLAPLERAMIPTGLSFEIPEGMEMQIRARSGLSIKQGLTLINGIGTIDADYRGELFCLMINLGQVPVTITHGMRVAQMMVARYEHVEWTEVNEISETARGKGGFGSTGIDSNA